MNCRSERILRPDLSRFIGIYRDCRMVHLYEKGRWVHALVKVSCRKSVARKAMIPQTKRAKKASS